MAKFHIRIKKESHLIIADQAIVGGGLPAKEGDRIWVSWTGDSMLFFRKIAIE